MKVLLLDETYPPDSRGSVPYTADLLAYGRKQGHTIDLVTVGPGHYALERDCGGSVHRMRCDAELDSARVSTQLLAFLVRHIHEYDIVHASHPNPCGEIGAILAAFLRKGHHPLVVSFHAEVIPAKKLASLYNAAVTRTILRLADAVIVASPHMITSVPVLAALREKVVVLPYGRTPPLRTGPATTSNGSGPLRILFVGRLVRYKGVEVLLKAVAQSPGIVRIVGDGPLRREIEKARDELGLPDRVVLEGRVSDSMLDQMYDWADVLVLPSTDRGEAFGYVLIEAMARSTALITTELGTGTSWVNIDGETGIVVPPRDPAALASAISRLASDPDLLQRCKSNALHRFQKSFTLNRMLTDTYALYERLARSESNRHSRV
jgi:rhamnosyl/mannosyltransferase